MTTQAFKREFESSPEKLAEAERLMKGLTFVETYSCCDGYESWESSRDNIDAFAELIERARDNKRNPHD